MSIKSGRTRTLDSNVWRNRFMIPTQTNNPQRIAFFSKRLMKSMSMIERKRIPPITPPSTNC